MDFKSLLADKERFGCIHALVAVWCNQRRWEAVEQKMDHELAAMWREEEYKWINVCRCHKHT